MLLRILVLAAVLWPVASHANMGPAAGDMEFTIVGTGANDRKFDNGAFGVSGSLGYYVTEDVLASLRQSVAYSDFGGGSNWAGSSRVALDYHVNLDRFRPLFGVNFGVAYGDDVRTTFSVAPELGAKYYVREKTFLFGLAEYQFFTNSSSRKAFDRGQFVYSLGVGFAW